MKTNLRAYISINSFENIAFFSLILAYCASRLYNLTLLPIFGDEAIYLNWAQTISEDSRQLFIPLSDGKQPLFMWLVALTTFIIQNPLLVTRLVAVLAGFGTMIGCFLVARTLFGKVAGVVAMLFYLVTPQLFFYDRLGVPDGLLATFGVFSLLAGLYLFKQPSFKIAVTTGCLIGLGYLAKSPALFYALLLPSVAFLHNRPFYLILKHIRFIGLAVLVVLITTQSLRVSDQFYQIRLRQADFIFGPEYILTNKFEQLFTRIPEVSGWLLVYLTPMVIGFFVIGIILALYNRQKAVGVLLLWWLVPLALEMELAKGFTPRYYLFTIPPFIMIAAYGMADLFQTIWSRKRWVAVLLILYFILPAYATAYYVTDLTKAPLPRKERAGYLEDWSSGWGIEEVAHYIKGLPVEQQILVGTEGHFGTLPDGLIVFMRKTPNIRIEGMGQPGEIYQVPEQLYAWREQSPNHRAFLVVNFSRMHITRPSRAGLILLATYPKIPGETITDSLEFYEVVYRPDHPDLLDEKDQHTVE